jgi:hypothetical protein
MTSILQRRSLRYLGSLRGSGRLAIAGHDCGPGGFDYEIDGYLDGTRRSAEGRIEGDTATLARAFRAGQARLTLDGGHALDIVLLDPAGGASAEVRVSGVFPL